MSASVVKGSVGWEVMVDDYLEQGVATYRSGARVAFVAFGAAGTSSTRGTALGTAVAAATAGDLIRFPRTVMKISTLNVPAGIDIDGGGSEIQIDDPTEDDYIFQLNGSTLSNVDMNLRGAEWTWRGDTTAPYNRAVQTATADSVSTLRGCRIRDAMVYTPEYMPADAGNMTGVTFKGRWLGAWVDLIGYTVDQCVQDDDNLVYRCIAVHTAAGTQPKNDGTNWTLLVDAFGDDRDYYVAWKGMATQSFNFGSGSFSLGDYDPIIKLDGKWQILPQIDMVYVVEDTSLILENCIVANAGYTGLRLRGHLLQVRGSRFENSLRGLNVSLQDNTVTISDCTFLNSGWGANPAAGQQMRSFSVTDTDILLTLANFDDHVSKVQRARSIDYTNVTYQKTTEVTDVTSFRFDECQDVQMTGTVVDGRLNFYSTTNATLTGCDIGTRDGTDYTYSVLWKDCGSLTVDGCKLGASTLSAISVETNSDPRITITGGTQILFDSATGPCYWVYTNVHFDPEKILIDPSASASNLDAGPIRYSNMSSIQPRASDGRVLLDAIPPTHGQWTIGETVWLDTPVASSVNGMRCSTTGYAWLTWSSGGTVKYGDLVEHSGNVYRTWWSGTDETKVMAVTPPTHGSSSVFHDPVWFAFVSGSYTAATWINLPADGATV